MSPFYFILAAYGMTHVIRDGHLGLITDQLGRIRFFQAMFTCPLCTGAECGFWGYLLYSAITGWEWTCLLDAGMIGLASGGFCFFADLVEQTLE